MAAEQTNTIATFEPLPNVRQQTLDRIGAQITSGLAFVIVVPLRTVFYETRNTALRTMMKPAAPVQKDQLKKVL